MNDILALPCKPVPPSKGAVGMPVYLVQSDCFKRGIMVRPQYYSQVLIVDGISSVADVFSSGTLAEAVKTLIRPTNDLNIRLEVPRVSSREAALIADSSDSRITWKGLLSRVVRYPCEEAPLLCYRLIFITDDGMVDSFTGNTIPIGDLLSKYNSM